jgi:hypothetical protein
MRLVRKSTLERTEEIKTVHYLYIIRVTIRCQLESIFAADSFSRNSHSFGHKIVWRLLNPKYEIPQNNQPYAEAYHGIILF